MREERLLAILRLQKTKSVGDILAKKLIAAVGDVEQIFRESIQNLIKIDGVGSAVIKALQDNSAIKIAEKELAYLQSQKINYSYFLDDDYPYLLKHCVDGPILFFHEGSIDFTNDRIISIVGTRNITSYGRERCQEIISDLTPYNPVIVSGFAYGVDIESHKSAIKNNLQTIGVLAHGFEQIYPKSHKKYVHEVMKNGGFITEFWHNENPLRENFLKRNRIVAGLANVTIVVESAEKGGSLVTADIANSYSRDVFAVPGKTTDIYSKGCNNLIQDNKAHLLDAAETIAKMLNWDSSSEKGKSIAKRPAIDLNENEQKVYIYLQENGKQLLDVISLACSIPIYELSSILLQMELKGIVKPLPGKLFEV